MKFENINVYNFENAFRGMRNPKNSWDASDSVFGIIDFDEDCALDVAKAWADATDRDQLANFVTDDDLINDYLYWLWSNGILCTSESKNAGVVAFIGPNDMKLAQTLIKGGPEHRKFLRQIFVSVDITAPLYWWKEFDTYKVGTVANSTSTMHKLTSKEITLDNFEIDDFVNIEYDLDKQRKDLKYPIDEDFVQMCLIPYLEFLRTSYLENKDNKEKAKIIWKELIRWLPESWLQTRTVTMNYENLLAMCSKGQRRFHKLTEWSGTGDSPSFIKFARQLPYAQELIFLDEII